MPRPDRRQFVWAGLGALLPTGGRAAPDAPPAGRGLPPFSWDRVPVYGHVRKSAAHFSADELAFLAEHFPAVTVEKGQAFAKTGSTEDGILRAARDLKRLSPRLAVLFYWNAFIDWPLYTARARIKPEWYLRDQDGKLLWKTETVNYFDLSNADCRAWWSDVAAAALWQGPLDGLFVDALLQVLAPAMRARLGDAKADAIRAGLIELLRLTRRKIGPDKVILANCLRTGRGTEALAWDLSGGMVEHFGHFRAAAADAVAADLRGVEVAAAAGKMVVVKAWPGFSYLDADQMKRPHAELAQRARERITFPLACFLAAAQEHCYFCYTWGYTESDGTFDWYPEFDRPLGPPAGPARRTGTVYERQFARAAVWVDLSTRQARIDWR